MGQSQSLIEFNKSKPIHPDRIFGLVFFNRKYDSCVRSNTELAELEWGMLKENEASKYFKDEFNKEFQRIIKEGTEDEKAEYQTYGKAVTAWKNKHKAIWTAKFYPQERNQKGIAELATKLKPTQAMGDLHATYTDGKVMFDFLEEYVCKQVSDITVMSNKRDFYRLYSKPSYEGDFFSRIFDWNINPESLDFETKIIHRDVNKHPLPEADEPKDKHPLPKADEPKVESWHDFNKKILTKAKYKAKHETRKWKKQRVVEMIDWYKDAPENEQEKIKLAKKVEDIIPDAAEHMELKKKYFRLTELKKKSDQLDAADEEALKQLLQDEDDYTQCGPKMRFKMKDYWEKTQDKRAQIIFKMMHPLIFLKEKRPAFEKIQSNWIFQCLPAEKKKEFLQNRIPKHQDPSYQSYDLYLKELQHYHDNHETEEILSLQTFACHGVVTKGCQAVLLNEYSQEENFYQMIHVEFYLRRLSKEMPRCYFLTLFACCRESYVAGAKKFSDEKVEREKQKKEEELEREKELERQKEAKNVKTRGLKGKISSNLPANFTFLFGCNPAEGVFADTKFVTSFVEHCKGLFDPEEGTVLIPECLGIIDGQKDKVNFESTSCNMGKSLRLKRYDNAVGYKYLLIITRNNATELCYRTKRLKKFFQRDLGFKDNEILQITENEARKYEDAMNQSKVFKNYNKGLQQKLIDFAAKMFDGKTSSHNQMLTICINESDQEDIKDFVINRNPELGLNIIHNKSFLLGKEGENDQRTDEQIKQQQDEIVKIYVRNLRENLKSMNYLRFSNLNTFFHNTMGVITFTTRNLKFKHGTGEFEYILELKEKINRTLKFKYEYLQRKPLRQNAVNKHTIGLPIKTSYGKQVDPYYCWIGKAGERVSRKWTEDCSVVKLNQLNAQAQPEESKELNKKVDDGMCRWDNTKKCAEVHIKPLFTDTYNADDPNNTAVLAMELIDMNDKFNSSEIKQRNKAGTKVKDNEDPNKYLFAYTYYRNDIAEDIEKYRKNAMLKKIKLPGLNFRDDVLEIKKLYHDIEKKKLYFQILLQKQESVHIGTLDYSEWKERFELTDKKIDKWEDYEDLEEEEFDPGNGREDPKAKEKRQKEYEDKIKAQRQAQKDKHQKREIREVENWDATAGIKIEMFPKKIIDSFVKRDPDERDEDECSLPFRAWPTEMEFNYNDRIEKEQDIAFYIEMKNRMLKTFISHKLQTAIAKKCCSRFDEGAIMAKWKTRVINNKDNAKLKKHLDSIKRDLRVSVPHTNLNVIAHRDWSDDILRFYVFTNRMLINGKNSEMEIEVWEWNEGNCEPMGDDEDFGHFQERVDKKITRMEHEVDAFCRRISPNQDIQFFEESEERKRKLNRNELEIERVSPEENKRREEEFNRKKKEKLEQAQIAFNNEIQQKRKRKYMYVDENYKEIWISYDRGEKDYTIGFEKKKMSREDKKKKKEGKQLEEQKMEVEKFEYKKQSTRDRRVIDKDGKEVVGKKVTRLFVRYLIYNDDMQQSFYKKRLMNFTGDKEDREFWLKPPSCWHQASDTPERLIFAAGQRGNYIFDLKMERGYLKLYTPAEKKDGISFGFQLVPYAKGLDMIEKQHISLLVQSKEAKWWKTLKCNLNMLEEKGLETQVTTLPKIVWFPDELPYFESTQDDYKKAADEAISERRKVANAKNPVKKEVKAEKKMTEEEKRIEMENKKWEDIPMVKQRPMKFLFAVDKQSISVVNITDPFQQGQEFLLVRQKAITEHDKIESVFITYEQKKKRITLHYFEKFFDYYQRIIQSTYNKYDLSEDFLSMLINTGELIPSEQPRLIKRVKNLKNPQNKLIELMTKENRLQKLADDLKKSLKDLEKNMPTSTIPKSVAEFNNKHARIMGDLERELKAILEDDKKYGDKKQNVAEQIKAARK